MQLQACAVIVEERLADRHRRTRGRVSRWPDCHWTNSLIWLSRSSHASAASPRGVRFPFSQRQIVTGDTPTGAVAISLKERRDSSLRCFATPAEASCLTFASFTLGSLTSEIVQKWSLQIYALTWYFFLQLSGNVGVLCRSRGCLTAPDPDHPRRHAAPFLRFLAVRLEIEEGGRRAHQERTDRAVGFGDFGGAHRVGAAGQPRRRPREPRRLRAAKGACPGPVRQV
jgi:hypothetical protein